MGIDADKYIILGGAGTFSFQYSVEILVNSVLVYTDYKVIVNQNTTHSDWKLAYDHLKTELTTQGITFTDNV